MGAFLVSVDATAAEGLKDIPAVMAELEAVPISSLLWGLSAKADEQELREWFKCKFGANEAVRLLALHASPSEASEHLSKEAIQWFEEALHLRAATQSNSDQKPLKWQGLKRKTILA